MMSFAHIIDLTLRHIICKVEARNRDMVDDTEPSSMPIKPARSVVRVI